jgi:hypothetical protein
MKQVTNIDPALSKFVEKLAALRQTMNANEQVLLDEMVANTAFDVEAHIRVIAPKSDLDVSAHRSIIMPAASDRAITFRFNPAVGYEVASGASGLDEDVSAHRFIQP